VVEKEVVVKAIMIADDRPETRDRVRGYLESRGYDVFGAGNGHARGTPLEGHADVVLLDLEAPVNGHNPYVPIISVTGFARHADSPNGTGSDEFVDFRALREKVSAALRARAESAAPAR
jgi:CheY-like chemotaxis protein